jgi:hypothetical protein
VAFYSAPSPSLTRVYWRGPAEELKPKQTDQFDPGANDASRPLAPFEVFEAMRLDLHEWFDLTKPGGYRVHVKFTAESGVGEGASNDWYFTIGDRDGSVP